MGKLADASTPSSLKARSVKVAESMGTTVTGLSTTTPGRGSMRMVVAPLTE